MIPRQPEWFTLEERVVDGRRAGLQRPADPQQPDACRETTAGRSGQRRWVRRAALLPRAEEDGAGNAQHADAIGSNGVRLEPLSEFLSGAGDLDGRDGRQGADEGLDERGVELGSGRLLELFERLVM